MHIGLVLDYSANFEIQYFILFTNNFSLFPIFLVLVAEGVKDNAI